MIFWIELAYPNRIIFLRMDKQVSPVDHLELQP
jgi:hypothetical protein